MKVIVFYDAENGTVKGATYIEPFVLEAMRLGLVGSSIGDYVTVRAALAKTAVNAIVTGFVMSEDDSLEIKGQQLLTTCHGATSFIVADVSTERNIMDECVVIGGSVKSKSGE